MIGSNNNYVPGDDYSIIVKVQILICAMRPNRHLFFFSSRRRHTRLQGDWSSDVCSSDLYGGAALVKRLLSAGANPNTENVAGATALMWAAPDVDTMQLLLDAGADVNARSDDRRTPLVVASGIVEIGRAACRGRVEISGGA